MPDTFFITILFVVICTVVGAFLKGRSKDRCLRDFSGYPVILENTGGKSVWGELQVENSGLELLYKEPYLDKEDNHIETSYILYKNEYEQVKLIVRYVDDMDPALARAREKELKKTRRPSVFSRYGRKIRNFFGTVRDSLLEIANLFIGKAKALTPAGKMLQGQDKYVAQLQQQAGSALNNSYEPILERYIGKEVIMGLTMEGKKKEYAGILKEYTTDFVEIMDTRYTRGPDETPRKADMVVPRALGIVRHSGKKGGR